MTQAANGFYVINTNGIREDLTDDIWNISPTDTMFMNAVGKTKSKQQVHSWQIDTLNPPNITPSLEGDDFTPDSRVKTTRLSNSMQTNRRSIQVSGWDNYVIEAGRKEEAAYQAIKASKELKRDIETVVLNNQAGVVPTVLGTVFQTRGLPAWMATNNVIASGTFTAGTATTAATYGTTAAPTLTNVNLALQNAYQSGGEPDTILVTPNQKQELSAFVQTATTKYNTLGKTANDTTLTIAYDVLASDFGVLRIVPDRFISYTGVTTNPYILCLDSSKAAIAYGRAPFVMDIAPTGDATKTMVLADFALEMRNEAAHAMIVNVT